MCGLLHLKARPVRLNTAHFKKKEATKNLKKRKDILGGSMQSFYILRN